MKRISQAEESGIVADSFAVRKALLESVKAGEITLKEAQAKLEKIKRGAQRAGKITRQQAWEGYQPDTERKERNE